MDKELGVWQKLKRTVGMLLDAVYHSASAVNNVTKASDKASSVLVTKAKTFKKEAKQELAAQKAKALSV